MKEKTKEDLIKEITELKKQNKELQTLVPKYDKTLDALSQSEEKYRLIVENSRIAVAIVDIEGTFLFLNSQGAKFHGADSFEQLKGKTQWDLFPTEVADKQMEDIRFAIKTGNRLELETMAPQGEKMLWFEVIILPLKQEIDNKKCVILLTRDITKRKNTETKNKILEEQLRLSQKLESIGQLAGGIAHDFNNLLTPIIGYSEIALMDLDKDSPVYEQIKLILSSGKKAKDLTTQLLAFSRKQVLEMKAIDLSSLINDLKKMLSHTIRENIEIEFCLKKDLDIIMADPTQIEQLIINFTLNAQDAMPNGGKMTIETSNIHIDEEYIKLHTNVMQGDYVLLTISDNGHGMNEQVLSQIFEPFFTTKECGKGTGLGLSMAYGIVKQHNGYIWTYSEPKIGTTFKIYFPRVNNKPDDNKENYTNDIELRGNETILIVEDDKVIKDLASEILTKFGYNIIIAENVENAINIAKNEKKINLLLTDVIMPQMNGNELFDTLKNICPDIKVLYMSGYTNNVIARHGILESQTYFVQKPFNLHTLSVKVREVLDK